MKRVLFLSALFIAITGFTAFAENNADDVSVTIYNNNLGVVRETRHIDVPKGISEIHISDLPKYLIPATVKISLEGRVLEQNFRYDVADMLSILKRYMEKEIMLVGDKTIAGKLISIDNNYKDQSVILQKSDGGLVVVPNLSKYQISVPSLPEGLVTRPTLFWTVDASKKGSQDVELTYQTNRMGWEAEYILVLGEDDKEAELDSWVSLTNNSGATYYDANLKLVAGNVQIIKSTTEDDYSMRKSNGIVALGAANFKENAMFEYHVYTLERKTTLANAETKQIALFNSDRIVTEKKYNYSIPDYNTEAEHPRVCIEFANSKANRLGNPLPEGNFRVMKADGKNKELVGECKIKHTPKDEKVSLELGDAFDVVLDATIASDKMIADKVNEREFVVKAKNHKAEPITVDISKYLSGDAEVISCSEKWTKENANNIKIPVRIGAESEKEVKIKIRTVYR